MEHATAFCGLDCSKCEAFLATINNDENAKMAVLEKWSKEYGIPNLTIDGVTCLGCRSETVILCSHCIECDIRACGLKRGVENCAYCLDFDSCKKLSTFFQQAPIARDNLSAIRATLKG